MLVLSKPVRDEMKAPERNALLRSIPRDEYDRVTSQATTVPLRHRHDLVASGERFREVLFPQSGMLSVVNDMLAPKNTIELAVIGREGFMGVPLLHGVYSQPWRVLVQVPGEAKRVAADTFLTLVKECPTLSLMLHRYAAALANQTSQQVACNRLHALEQRCAKWLLTTHDHLDSQELPLTQEFLAVMLGVRRPGVTVAAQALQEAGLIRYRRGRISVTDRGGLEKLACECYERIRQDYERLLGEFMVPRASTTRDRAPKLA